MRSAGGRVRIDAIARWLQDAAYLDLIDAGFAERGVWIVRRCRIAVAGFPRFGEEVAVRTFCSAIGRFAAERRTSVQGAARRSRRSRRGSGSTARRCARPGFRPEFISVYEESAGGVAPTSAFAIPSLPTRRRRAAWTFRADDVDVAGHVNNSHHWAALEQEWAAAPPALLRRRDRVPRPGAAGPGTGARRWRDALDRRRGRSRQRLDRARLSALSDPGARAAAASRRGAPRAGAPSPGGPRGAPRAGRHGGSRAVAR